MKTAKFVHLPPEELFGMVEELLQEDYEATFTVTGNSMWPFLTHGRDQVTLRSLDNRAVKKGDILLFCPEKDRYLLHRVMSIQGCTFRSAGDGNNHVDGSFPTASVIGRVTTFCRNGRHISCQNLLYRLCSHLWIGAFPLRKPLLCFLRTVAKGINRS